MFSLKETDARVKMALMLVVSTLSVVSRQPAHLACLFAFSWLVLALGGVKYQQMWPRLRGACKLMASVAVLQLLFNCSGEALLRVGGFALITRGGCTMALVTALRLLTVLLCAALVMTGDIRDYLLGLSQWHVPYEIVFMLLAGLRFLPALREESRDVLYAVQMRGVDLKRLPLRGRLRVYLRVMAPIVARTVQRSEQMAIAMEARAFRAMDRRTAMRTLHMRRSDWLVLSLCMVVLALITGITGFTIGG